jgi:hypothetical protein
LQVYRLMKYFFAFFKNRWLSLAMALLLLSTAFYIDNFREKAETDYEQINYTLQSHLQAKEKGIDKLLANDSFIYSFLKGGFSLESKARLEKRGLVLLIYKDSSLVFWSDNIADPQTVLSDSTQEINVLNTSNGWYLTRKRTQGKYVFALLYHFYSHYQNQNRYLQSQFNTRAGIKNAAEISKDPQPEFTAIKSIYGKKLFYIGLHPYTHNSFTLPVVILTLLGLWMFFIFLSHQYEHFIDKNQPLAGTVFFALF